MASGFLRMLSAVIAVAVTTMSGCGVPEYDSQINFEDYGCTMYFMDVGNADSCLISCDGEYMLIDGGNNNDSEPICNYLESNGIKSLKYVVATHPHEDHIGGLDDVLEGVGVQQVIMPDCDYSSQDAVNLLNAIDSCGAAIEYADVGDEFTLGNGSFEVVGPVVITDNQNSNSVVLRFDYAGVSALFTGDAERSEEDNMLYAGLIDDVDILKVGHHGSREGSSYPFLRATMPEYAVITCGEGNMYGHPHDEAIGRLEDCGATVYRTDEMGGIILSTNGESIKVTTSDLESEVPVNENTQVEDKEEMYIGNINSHVYHTQLCKSLPKEENRTFFATKEEAENQGYKPCGNCKP